MIFYFSGTGNSRYIAERIAAATGDGIISINDRIREGDTTGVDTDGRVVVAVPTYAWRIPHVVEEWIRDTAFSGAENAWFVMTCGDETGSAASYNQRLCEEKHWQYMGTAGVVMPENYIAMFAVPKPATARKIILNAEPAIQAAAECIAAGRKLPENPASAVDRLKSSVVNPAFYSLFVKARAFRVTDGCTGCGQCAAVCPLRNIEIRQNKPVWGGHCTHCMACISYCPAEAVEYGRKSVGKPRYRFDLPLVAKPAEEYNH